MKSIKWISSHEFTLRITDSLCYRMRPKNEQHIVRIKELLSFEVNVLFAFR
jgi:hypothetical protein